MVFRGRNTKVYPLLTGVDIFGESISELSISLSIIKVFSIEKAKVLLS